MLCRNLALFTERVNAIGLSGLAQCVQLRTRIIELEDGDGLRLWQFQARNVLTWLIFNRINNRPIRTGIDTTSEVYRRVLWNFLLDWWQTFNITDVPFCAHAVVIIAMGIIMPEILAELIDPREEHENKDEWEINDEELDRGIESALGEKEANLGRDNG